MSEKKLTKAQQAAGPKKRKGTALEPVSSRKTAKDILTSKKLPKPLTRGDAAFPLRYVVAAVCAVMLLIFVSIYLKDDGLLQKWFRNLICGLFGRPVYYITAPALVLLILIQLLSKGKPVRRRTFCVCVSVLCTGCMLHLHTVQAVDTEHLFKLGARFSSGISGESGGVICGLVTDLLVLGFGRFFIFSMLLITAVLCLLFSLRMKPIGWGKKLVSFLWTRYEQRRDARRSADGEEQYEDDGYEDDPDFRPGLWERLLDRAATRQAARVERKLQEAAHNTQSGHASHQRTEQLLRQYAPEMGYAVADEAPDDIPADTAEPETAPAPIPEAPVAPAPKDKVTARDAAISAALMEQEIAAAQAAPKPEYAFPPIELLKLPRGRAADGTAEMRENTRRLNESLASYKIDAHISNVTRGPSVTRYEVELEKGVRLNKLTSCADDIALSLGASGVRIAPVPGKISVVGIEVPNQTVTNVSLRDVIDSPEFRKAGSHSSIAVGKDIGGSCIIGNIARFPHMLIAGTTGSGKSVCMNSIIISLLYKASPEDVKLIMVDPKMVELGIYNGIPHLLIPVVTDPKKAAGSLQWAVTEMMRRYRSMSDAGVRDLESYNSMIVGGEIEGEKLPQIVVIIDELADLMLVAAKEVEESICRIAQMGRAAGIHLIIATQRPSADVITGLMKANIPSRIAFAVASAMESRIILDTVGAEKLVGKGDMLYSPIGSGKPQRVQGCFVTDTEVEAVATYVKEHFASTYDQTVMDDIERKAEQTGSKSAPPTASDPDPSADELAHDEMLPDAVDVILETKQASVSLLQRRLKLGYARAARIVDEMEEMGIVGPFVGSKPRQILITKEQWDQMKQGQTIVTQPEPVPEDIDVPF